MQIEPEYMVDYEPGFTGFSVYDDSGLSAGISWFQKIEELQIFLEMSGLDIPPGTVKFSESPLERCASHVFMVVDKERGLESAEKGVEFFDLQQRIADPNYKIVFRKPQRLSVNSAGQMLNRGLYLEKIEEPYGYTDLVGKLIGMIDPLNKIPFWPFTLINKLPVLFNVGGMYCSAFDADCKKHTTEYENEEIFKKYHVTRVSPVLWWYGFCWVPFKYTKGEEKKCLIHCS